MAIIKGEEGLRVEILYRAGALGSVPQVKEERERERGVGKTIKLEKEKQVASNLKGRNKGHARFRHRLTEQPAVFQAEGQRYSQLLCPLPQSEETLLQSGPRRPASYLE